jgi:hypothetical protein
LAASCQPFATSKTSATATITMANTVLVATLISPPLHPHLRANKSCTISGNTMFVKSRF